MSNLVGALKREVAGLRAENEALTKAFASGCHTGFLVLFGDECRHVASAADVPGVLPGDGSVVTVVNLERLGEQ